VVPQRKPLVDAELVAFEASQDFEALLVQSAREIGAVKTRVVDTSVPAARKNTGVSQVGSAELPGEASQRAHCRVPTKHIRA
jgi:putative transcriptional regulator